MEPTSDHYRGASRVGAHHSVLAGVPVLPSGLQAIPAAAVHRVLLRVGKLGDDAADPALRFGGRRGRWPRVSHGLWSYLGVVIAVVLVSVVAVSVVVTVAVVVVAVLVAVL